MQTLLTVFAVSLACCLLLTPAVRLLASRYGLVDAPDGRRKLQSRAIPLGGGLAIFLSAVVGVLAAIFFTPLREDLADQFPVLAGLGIASLLIAAVGLADDCRGMRGMHKLLGQLAAVAIVMSSGVVIRSVNVFGMDANLGLLSFPLTAFFLLGAVNSLNLLDGMDGMLSCIGLIICLAITIIAALLAHWTAACIAVALAGALLGFLRYNSPPATIFMGDCGSMVVGLVIGVVAIEGSLKGPATVALAAPLALLTLPIFDASAAVVRRKLSGRSIFVSDRGHLHHCLLRRGLTAPGALCCVSALSLLTLVGAVASVAWHAQWIALASVVAVFSILVATRLFGHAELELLTKRLSAKLFRGRAQRGSHRMEVRLQGSADWDGLWRDLTLWAEDLKLQSVCLDINAPALHEAYFGRWECDDKVVEEHDLWRVQVPLVIAGHSLGRLETVGRRHERTAGWQMAVVASLLERLEASIVAMVGRSTLQAAAVSLPRSSTMYPSLAAASRNSADATGLSSLAHRETIVSQAATAIYDGEPPACGWEKRGPDQTAEPRPGSQSTGYPPGVPLQDLRKPR